MSNNNALFGSTKQVCDYRQEMYFFFICSLKIPCDLGSDICVFESDFSFTRLLFFMIPKVIRYSKKLHRSKCQDCVSVYVNRYFTCTVFGHVCCFFFLGYLLKLFLPFFFFFFSFSGNGLQQNSQESSAKVCQRCKSLCTRLHDFI